MVTIKKIENDIRGCYCCKAQNYISKYDETLRPLKEIFELQFTRKIENGNSNSVTVSLCLDCLHNLKNELLQIFTNGNDGKDN